MLHVTTALIAAFFVFFAAERSSRPLRIVGFFLGAWLIVVAGVQAFIAPPPFAGRLPQPSVPPHAPTNTR